MLTPRTSAAIAQSFGLDKHKRRQKFNAKPCYVEGIRFASQKEARRYCELVILQRTGQIHELERQPRYSLDVWGSRIGWYVADFRYCTCHDSVDCCGGREVIEDVKGVDTQLSKWKRRHTEAQYGIRIELIR